MSRLFLYLQSIFNVVLGLCTIAISGGCSHLGEKNNFITYSKDLVVGGRTIKDSVQLPFLFYPERWFLTDNKLYILNNKDSLFLTVFDVRGDSVIFHGGTIGNGPGEYTVPSLGEMKQKNKVVIYSNGQNRLDTYNLNGGKLELKDIRHFPVWYKERGLPKAYTQLQQYNDSLFVGISFMPREIVVELIDTNNECIRGVVDFPLKPSASSYSGPFECKISVSTSYMAIAYRYINRIEIYHISAEGFSLEYVLGDDKLQEDLYNQDRDDEMILYYSDVYCNDDYIYALYQGISCKDLSSARSHVEIYSLKEGKNIDNLELDELITDFTVGPDGMIYGYNPFSEEYLFMFFKSSE